MKTINESINKAYSYIRFSSKKQELGDSLRRQLQSAQAYCTRNGLQLNSSSYRDLGVSAFKGLNTQEDNGLGQFLTACSTGRIQSGDYLLVESLDRMSRQHVQTALRQFLNILSYGVTIVTLLDNRSYTIQSDTTDLIISITIMARAYEESATKSKRLKSAWDNKRTRLQDGSATTKSTSLAPHWLNLSSDRTSWLVDSDKADIIKLIFTKSVNGYGQNKLVKFLNSNNYPSPRGNGWAVSSVSRILTDKHVLGHYQPHEFIAGVRTPVGAVIEDYYTPIITESLYYQVQAHRKARLIHQTGSKGDKFTNLLQGIAKCGNCNATMHIIDKGKEHKGSKYLICSIARKGGDCKYISYRYDHVERSVLQQLLQEKHLHLLSARPTNTAQLENSILAAASKLNEANERLEGFLSLVDDFTLPSVKSAYITQQKTISELTVSLESLKGELANSSNTNSIDINAIFQLVADALQVDLIATKSKTYSMDDLYELRIKLNSIIKVALGSVSLTKEYIKQSNQLIHCTSKSVPSWSIQVGRGTIAAPLWHLAGWAE
jgi:DNA invertase Pin-like site-specific DNA recombinase